ncbi:hypothetical protein BDP55DRAFT_677351 [Colletotrichum godetiae]|uniref:Uncharacterized protein n=1 Tax=Colletotrichum godetiae TaxID=1209918 RepID=A0AAJ0ABJ9_9PEZI|nr:uncharacterized protein BDP55DRAFT_677351 [Colletotrichum godetiae]KAK1660117.1 hypothetical protein BDP55DRAFT_677351 [Colletotrichum godetiae]
MGIDVTNAMVDFCKWATAKRPDGSNRRYKYGDCHNTTCHWSMDYSKDLCHCFDKVEAEPKTVAEDAVEDAEK